VNSITGRQFYCGERCKERAAWKRERLRPEIVAANRARCKRWSAANGGAVDSNHWLDGAPPYGEYLPGGGMSLTISPPPKWALEHRSVRALHGMVTGLSGQGHDPTTPKFSLIPTRGGSQWSVLFQSEAVARSLAGRVHHAILFDRPVAVRCGLLHRLRAPVVTTRGHRTLRVDAITPVHIRKDGGHHTHLYPTARNLTSTMASWLPRLLGLELGEEAIQLHLVERHTMPEHTPLGGKYGCVSGWSGHIIVDTNATGEWMLRAAEVVGLGGRVAFGFGRIRVTHVE
jgi:hypothetical protein